MIDWGYLAAKLFTTIASWIDAGNLRNRMYKMAEEAEIMMTALEDIERMGKGNELSKYAQKAINIVKGLPNDRF